MCILCQALKPAFGICHAPEWYPRYAVPLCIAGMIIVDLPETVEVGPQENVNGSVIWLHGLGADGRDFEAMVPQLNLSDDLKLRFVFPHAPVRPVTLNGGMAMRAWYDIVSLDRDGPVDAAGIRDSVAMLRSLIERERERGVPYANIVLAGFSQGGAIALHCGLGFEEKLAGLMALSTYLPLHKELTASAGGQPRDLRIFMAHGTADPMLPMHLGAASRDLMESCGYSVAWFEYPMPHAVCPQEIADISRWLTDCYNS